MPYKEKIIEKKYYSIGEVAHDLGVATSLIRFWESEFDIIKPGKNSKGIRQYTFEDLQNIRLIYELVKVKGYTLQGARELLKKEKEVLIHQLNTVDKLKKIRQFLVELKGQL